MGMDSYKKTSAYNYIENVNMRGSINNFRSLPL